MNWLLIVLALLLAASVAWGIYRGLLRVIYSMAAWIIILVFVTWATPHVADWMIKNTPIGEKIESNCKDELREFVNGDEEKKEKAEKETEKQDLQELEVRIPDVVLDKITDTHKVADELLEDSGTYDAMATRASNLAMTAIAFLVVLLITFLVLHILSQVLDLISKLPVIGGVNHVLGGLAGFIKGIVLIWLLFAFVAMGSATTIGSVMLEAIYDSPILVWIYENNLVLTILMMFL